MRIVSNIDNAFMLQRLKNASKSFIIKICYKISPTFVASYRYKLVYGRYPNFKHPKSFHEKLTALKVGDYSRNPLVIQCADKYRVRQYIEVNGLGGILNTLIGVYDTMYEIDYDTLPDSFVVKSNCGCGDIIICMDKHDVSIRDLIFRRFEKQSHFYMFSAEPFYGHIKPCIVVERFLSQAGSDRLIDYKVFCFNGIPDHVLVCYDRTAQSHSVACYDCSWKPLLNHRKSCTTDQGFPKPASFERMLEAAKILSRPFPFVRMDFYDISGELVFGEMTFTPNACLCREYTKEAEQLLGAKLKLAPRTSKIRDFAARLFVNPFRRTIATNRPQAGIAPRE